MSEPIEIIVPRLGWSMEQGAFVAWHKNDGEFVRAGEALFSIEGDKAIQEIESIDSGILRIAPGGPKPGDAIRVGDVLGHLLPARESSQKGPPIVSKPVVEPISVRVGPASANNTVKKLGDESLRSARTAADASRPAISPRALRVAAELGIDWTVLKGSGRTGRIRESDVRAAADFRRI